MFRLDSESGHRACHKLLPWYVNGTLEPAERAAVERHLDDCDACRRDVSSLEELRGCVRAAPESADAAAAARGLRQVLDRIDAGAGSRGAGGRTWQDVRLAVRWALAGQAAAILALLTLVLWPAAPETAPGLPASYRTLSDPPAASGQGEDAGATLRVVFGDGVTEAELRRLLRSVGGDIVAGPSAVGVYTLRLPAPGDEALERLRADPRVRLAEPVRPR